MNNRLNFKYPLFVFFLAFVSLQYTYAGTTSTSVQSAPSQELQHKHKPEAEEQNQISHDSIEELKSQIQKNPQDIGKIIELASVFYDKGDFEKTTLLLWKQIDKINRAGFLLLSRAHEQRKEYSEMVRVLNILVAKNEKDFEALTQLGNAFSLQKKTKDALENYKKAIEVNPKFEAAYQGVANLYEKRTPPNLYELRILYQDMIDNMGPKGTYLQKLCEINSRDDMAVEASIETCRKATVKDPHTADAFVNLGNSLKASGKNEEAIELLKKTANTFPKSEFAQYSFAKVLEGQKNSVEAMKYYKAGTDIDPKSARSWLGLANSSFEVKKYEVAFIGFKNACKYDRKNAVAFRKATTFLRNNKVSEWIGKYEAAAESCSY